MPEKDFSLRFADFINAGFPMLYIPSYEEERVMRVIMQSADDPVLIRTPRKVLSWTQTDGFSDHEKLQNSNTPLAALDYILRFKDPAIFVLKDFHVFFGADRGTHPEYAVIRKLRDLLPHLKQCRKTIVFLCPRMVIPPDLEKDISVLDFALPDADELEQTLSELTEGLSQDAICLSADERSELIKSSLGLTVQEAENAFCRAIIQSKGLNRNALSIIRDEKNQIIKKSGILEFVHSDLGLEDIGGLERLKLWLVKRSKSWQERARVYHLPAPKGVLITGVPGCGKSLTAKAMSGIWNLPLLKLDIGRIFGGIVGSSEENMRKAIRTAEAVAPSVLWVDEIEKGFSGTGSSGDSGTAARVFGTFLTWMQEKTAPVFVIATANNITGLPPELLRKGRFDEVFFVDLPDRHEREQIFRLHLKTRMQTNAVVHEFHPDSAALQTLAQMTEGFSGAEIEQVVLSALYEAFFEERGLRLRDLTDAIRETVPLSVVQADQIRSLRCWAVTHAVPAAAKADDSAPTAAGEACASAQNPRILDYQ